MHLGEGTEQFTVTTKLSGKIVGVKAIHDPFIHTKVVTTWWWKFWKPIVVEVSVGATPDMMRKVMRLEPLPPLDFERLKK
jgi:hypothetical protein